MPDEKIPDTFSKILAAGASRQNGNETKEAPPAEAETKPAAADIPPELAALIGTGERRLNAKEILANISKLQGVQGVMMVMSDGSLITSNLPAPYKSEIISAFLPQIFGRLGQYVQEFHMGALGAVTVHVEQGALQIVKQSNLFLAVLCQQDASVSASLLNAVAAHLNHQHK